MPDDKIVPIDATPIRRSGASNVASPRLQAEFINAARTAMGQPSAKDIAAFLGERVTIVFNDDREPITGVLTGIISHPTASRLVLDNDEDVTFPLNAVQSIERSEQAALE